jgi:colanic acid/amylovoran biosynthesis glycosyltransferase
VRDLRAIAPGANVHKVIMGIDGGRLERRLARPDGRRVVSVGRLVEKKGFADLIAAAALLDERGDAIDLAIVGDGPLRDSLAAQIEAAGLGDHVELLGARQPEDVLALVEQADVFCLPCVVAANGDRDSMPVVVKEALALEVPVVVTDEVGLPELVRPDWGMLVPPRNPAALADALATLLAHPASERAAMGRAGRAFVLEHCNVDTETARLAALIDGG